MSDKLTFYTNPMSRGRIVRWMLEEVGQPYDTVVLDYATTMKGAGVSERSIRWAKCRRSSTAMRSSPKPRPSAPISPTPSRKPNSRRRSGSKERGPYYRWLFYGAGPVEAMASNQALGVVVPDDKRGMVGYGSREQVIDTLEKALQGREYLAGDRFTAADLYVGAQIGWGLQFGTIDRRPAFDDYIGRVLSRPAALRAKEIDDGLIAAAQKAS